MRYRLRGIFLLACACVLALPVGAFAAPDRLNDDVPDAVPDESGAFAFSYGHEMLDLEGVLTSSRTAHDYFKLRYTFSPKISAALRYSTHDLVGEYGLLTPLFDGQDKADVFSFDLNLNLLNVPMTPADPDNEVSFEAGSSFGLGLVGGVYQLDQGGLSQQDSLLKAYLAYSTDLTEEMRAHTYFSTGRISGDSHTGSVNRIAAGLDYTLIGGRRPLVLMGNGILDIYNWRKPEFNTSRISRFDVGLRYQFARDWHATVGWVTINDSENDASGSGLFAGVNFVEAPKPPCIPCPPLEEVEQQGSPSPETTAALPPQAEQPKEEVAAATPAPGTVQVQADAFGSDIVAQAESEPTLMKSEPSAEKTPAASHPDEEAGAAAAAPNTSDEAAKESAEEPSAENDEQTPSEVAAQPDESAARSEEPAPSEVAEQPETETGEEDSEADAEESEAGVEESAGADASGTDEEQPASDEDTEEIASPEDEEETESLESSTDAPVQTPAGAVMIRPGTELPTKEPVHTSAADVMLRPPWGPFQDQAPVELVAQDSDIVDASTQLLATTAHAKTSAQLRDG